MSLTPKNRKEEWLQGLVDHETTLTPKNRPEEWMLGLIEGSTSLTPKNRCEEWLKEIIDASGGGGLEFEVGTWTPTEDGYGEWHYFANEHTSTPLYILMCDTEMSTVPDHSYGAVSVNIYSAYSGTEDAYAAAQTRSYVGVGSWGSGNVSVYTSALSNYVDNEKFRVEGTLSGNSWRAGRTYKWVAIWAPA